MYLQFLLFNNLLITNKIPSHNQYFDTINIQPTFQEYSDNNACDASLIPLNSSEDISGYNGVQLHQNNQG